MSPLTGLDGSLRDEWAGMPIEERRRIVGAVVDRVTVGPAVRGRNVFDPGRVSIVWRG